MRKIDPFKVIKNMRLTEKFLLEIGISKYLPFVVKSKSFNAYSAEFSIDSHGIEVEDSEGNWVSLADRGIDKITYTININGGIHPVFCPIDRDGFDTEIKIIKHSLTFSNSITSMSNLKGNVGILVFSTIAKIIDTFTKTYSDKFQCITFTPYQNKLVGTYEILSREAEKQSDLIYANKESGRRRQEWYLLNKKIWNQFLSIKGRQ